MKQLSGNVVATGQKVAIVVARFNDFITERLLDGAVDAFTRHGGNPDDLLVARVPGAFELPVLAKKLAAGGKYQAVVCLGAVIRGSTAHFDHVAGQAAGGIASAALETGVPVIFGVLTTDTIEQAIERAGTKAGNKGAEAMLSAIEMINVMKQV